MAISAAGIDNWMDTVKFVEELSDPRVAAFKMTTLGNYMSANQQRQAQTPRAQDSHAELHAMMVMRMRWRSQSPDGHPFHDIYPKRDGDKVHVFVIAKAGSAPVVLSDDWGLFPSDQFVTSLRLLEGK